MNLLANDVFTGQPIAIEIVDAVARVQPTSIADPECYISPAWCDIQVNGFGGFDANAADTQPADITGLVRRLWPDGVGRCLPTVITQSAAHIQHCLRAIATACEADAAVRASIVGIHLEGPYLSPLEGARGAHPPEHIRRPEWDEFLRFQDAAQGGIRLVTLAPEAPGAIPFIGKLVQAGIVVAIGHSLATTDEVRAAVDAGATLSTHLGNGAPAMLPRHPNLIWDQLAEDRLFASAIFDGHHLPASVMRVLLRAKGIDKTILTSDAVALAHMPPGIYERQVGGKVELSSSGRLSVYGTPYLAGSASSLKDCIENAMTMAGCTLAQACQMVTLNPAALLGLPDAPESFTVFRWGGGPRLQVIATVVDGHVVWQAQ